MDPELTASTGSSENSEFFVASEASLEVSKRKNIPGATWYHYWDGNWTLLVEDFPGLKELERDSDGFIDDDLVRLRFFSLKKLYRPLIGLSYILYNKIIYFYRLS